MWRMCWVFIGSERVLLTLIKTTYKTQQLPENLLYLLTAFVTRYHWKAVDCEVKEHHLVSPHPHDWGANSSEPIHMQCFHRTVSARSRENSLSPPGVGASLCLHSTEESDRVARFRSAQAQKVHRGVRHSTEGESSTEIPKAGPKQRLNPFMWGLFSCCEWRMHVWTPTVSKCLFTGCKSAASKLKDLKAAAL